MAKRYSNYLSAAVFLLDLLLLNLSIIVSYLFYFKTSYINYSTLVFIIIVNISWVFVAISTKSYKIKRPLVLSNDLNRFLITTIYHLLMIFGAIYFFQINDISRTLLIISYISFVSLIILSRSFLFLFLDYIRKRGYNKRHIIIVGDETIGDNLKNSFYLHPEYGYHLIDFVPNHELNNITEADLIDRFLSKRPDEIFLCYAQIDESILQLLVAFGEEQNIKINLVSDLVLNDMYAKLINYHNLPVLNVSNHDNISLKIKLLKRGFDLSFSITVMTLGLPVFVMIYIITKSTSKGAAFYRQERIGKNGKPFYIYKFRSMYINAEKEGPQLSTKFDPRITSWGRIIRKTRLDELPQFWNVFKGDMSIVGPRPERQYYIEKIIEKSPSYKQLLRIKPGITSIGQVSYGYAESVDQMCERSRYDMIYLKNINFKSDMNIIIKTVKVMVQAKGQ